MNENDLFTSNVYNFSLISGFSSAIIKMDDFGPHLFIFSEGAFIMNKVLRRLSGMTAAAMMLLTPLSAVPAVDAAEQTTKDIKTCDYVKYYEPGLSIVRNTEAKTNGVSLSIGDFGIPADEPVKEVWLDVSIDASSGLSAMPAIGYTAPGYVDPTSGEQTDWFGDGLWMQQAIAESTIVIKIPDTAPLTDKFDVQIWGEDGSAVNEMTVNAIGFMTGDGGTIGFMTRKGDVNNDKTVDIKDVTALADYLAAKSDTLAAPANGDLDKSGRLNGTDLTLLKRGLLDGSFNQTSTDETAAEFVKHIKIGWNLGNTLDAQNVKYPKSSPSEYEMSWGCPQTTKEMIDKVKESGFNLIRIPVSWGQKMDSSTYKINDAWMNRVQEIVDYAIDDGLYVILNIHHDNGEADENNNFITPNYPYFYPDSAHYQMSEKFVTSVWQQVAERFDSYDNHLIFETLNEPRLIAHRNEWWIDANNNDCKDAMNCVNKLNAAALNVIRKSGGNNAKRFVMMPSYAANADASTLTGVQMPNDDHVIAEIHAYTPYSFALDKNGTDQWSESNGGGDIVALMQRLKGAFLDKGIPVIIDEFGASNRNNEETRAAWAKFYVSTADKYGIPCVLWDNNQFGVGSENLGLLNRNTNTIQFPKLLQGLMDGAANRG